MTPVFLRHPRATRQSLAMGALATVTAVIAVAGLANYTGWVKLFALVPLALAVMFAYLCLRAASLRVRLDAEGLWEPNPFRLSYVTPWQDISQIRKHLVKRHVNFLTVEIVYRDGEERDIVALTLQAGAAGSEDAVDAWVEAIRAAKREALA